VQPPALDQTLVMVPVFSSICLCLFGSTVYTLHSWKSSCVTLMVATCVVACAPHTDPNFTLTVHLGRFSWLSNESESESVGAVSGSLGLANLTSIDESLSSSNTWKLTSGFRLQTEARLLLLLLLLLMLHLEMSEPMHLALVIDLRFRAFVW